jgi:hypothetical protein
MNILWFMVLNATFNYISVISGWSVLLVEETEQLVGVIVSVLAVGALDCMLETKDRLHNRLLPLLQ